MNKNLNNGTVFVTWKQLIFLGGLVVLSLGALFTLTLDTKEASIETRERVVSLEVKVDNLIERLDRGELVINSDSRF